jgi:hypothetical protein
MNGVVRYIMFDSGTAKKVLDSVKIMNPKTLTDMHGGTAYRQEMLNESELLQAREGLYSIETAGAFKV